MGIKSSLNAFFKADKRNVGKPRNVNMDVEVDIRRKEYSPGVEFDYEFHGHIKEATKGVWLYSILEMKN